jgi:hypothetical protein
VSDPCDVTPQMRYDMALDGLLARYEITERQFMDYVLPRIAEKDEMNIEAAERAMRCFKREHKLTTQSRLAEIARATGG